MRTLILCLSSLLFLALVITSCNDELSSIDFDDNHETQDRNGYEFEGLYHNGKWFVVEDESFLPGILASLTDLVDSYDAEGEEEEEGDEFVDDELILEDFEKYHGHKSFRRMLLVDEFQKLQEGQDPTEVLNSQEDLILNMVESSLLNEDKVIQVGRDLYHYYSANILILVENEDVDRLNSIINGGLIEAYHQSNVKFVSTNTFGPNNPEGPSGGSCTAEFTSADPIFTPNGEYDVVFTWAEHVNIGLWPNVTLTWDFGDGNTQIVYNNGTVTHTYSTFGTYTVTLTVNSDATVYGPACEDVSFTRSITIQQQSNSGPTTCEDYFCLTLNAIGIASPSALGNLLTDGALTPNNEVTFYLNNAMSAIFNYCTQVELNSIVWTVDGVTYTGTSFAHPVGCSDGREILGSIAFGNCSASFKYTTPTVCPEADCKQDWAETQYNGGNKKICYRTKTRSKNGDYFFGLFGSNKIQAKMRHYRKKSNGKWKKERKDLQIDATGTLGYNLACNCEGSFNVNQTKTKNNKKSIELEKKYNNYSDIHMVDIYNHDWFADFIVNNTTIESQWDASVNCN